MTDDYRNNDYAGSGASTGNSAGGDPNIKADTYNGPSGGGYAEPGSSADYSGPGPDNYSGPAAGVYDGTAAGGYGYTSPNSAGGGQTGPGGQTTSSFGAEQSTFSGGGGQGYQNYGGTPPPNYPPYGQNAYGYNAIPPEATGWNWGAFYFNWLWGIGNKCYLPLLCFVPFFGFVWMFVCGFKGNEWAWKSGEFANIEQFQASRRTWNRAGFIGFLVTCGFVLLYIILVAIIGLSMNTLLYGYY